MDDTPDIDGGDNSYRIAASELNSFVDRIMRLQDEKKENAAEFTKDIANVRAEAKGRGYDTKALNEVIRRRRLTEDMRALVDTYENAMEDMG